MDTRAFETVLEDGKCNMVQSDKGTEFLNSTFQTMLKRHGMEFYTSENEDLKAAVVERFNRTLKMKMFPYFTYANTRRYVDVLSDLMHSYNNTHHRSIGMSPAEVDADNERMVRARLYRTKSKSHRWKYDAGDNELMNGNVSRSHATSPSSAVLGTASSGFMACVRTHFCRHKSTSAGSMNSSTEAGWQELYGFTT